MNAPAIQTANYLSEIERQIIDRLVTDILAAGHRITVHDGEENTLRLSKSRRAIMEAVGVSDETLLHVAKSGRFGGIVGWVQLIHGNEADVISDYSTGIEKLVAGANALAAKF